jgi:hypothetical protein
MTTTTGNPQRSVSSFEHRVLTLLDALLGRTSPAALGLPPLQQTNSQSTLRRTAVGLIQQRLRRGLVSQLARDGWKPSSFFHDDKSRSGRLWQRHRADALSLTFSPFVIELLFWLASHEDRRKDPKVWAAPDRLTIGDRVFACVAWKALRGTPASAILRDVSPWANDGMVRLLWGDDVFRSASPRVDFQPWFEPGKQWLLEAWQDRLVRSFLHRASGHRQGDSVIATGLAESDRRTLDAFLRAANAANRRDLALWIVTAADRALREGPPVDAWFEGLDVSNQTIESRYESYRVALYLFELLDVLRSWNLEARRTGFMDEVYAASQHWKSRWEAMNAEEVLTRSGALRRRWSSP